MSLYTEKCFIVFRTGRGCPWQTKPREAAWMAAKELTVHIQTHIKDKHGDVVA